MRKRLILGAVTVMSLLTSVFLAGWPGAAFAHGQSAGAATRAAIAGLSTAPANKMTFQNRATNRCIDDSAYYGLRSHECNGQPYQQFFVTAHTRYGSNRSVYVLQNLATGSCVEDTPTGMQGTFCDPTSSNQQFFVTTYANNVWILQNLATGSCVADIDGLRGYFCNNQPLSEQWTPIYLG